MLKKQNILNDGVGSRPNSRVVVDGANTLNCAHDGAEEVMKERREQGGAELATQEAGRREIRNRAVSGLGARWAAGEREDGDVRVCAGGYNNCDIHTHTRTLTLGG